MANDTDPVWQLSKAARGWIASGLILLVITRVIWPALHLDTLDVGLVTAAAAMMFLDFESFDWFGLKVHRTAERIAADEATVAELRPADLAREAAEFKQSPRQAPVVPEQIAYPIEGLAPGTSDLIPPTEPLERLLWAVERVRRELIVLAGNTGILPDRRGWGEYHALPVGGTLSAMGVIPAQLTGPLITIMEFRNQILHGTKRQATKLVAAAGDLAVDVLNKLYQVPRNYFRIVMGDVPTFTDEALTVRGDINGVMIAEITEAGRTAHIGVYPRSLSYERKRFVSWEWEQRQAAGPAWYRDPATGRATQAWGASLFFAGRQYPQEWDLEYRLASPAAGLE